MMCGLRRLSTIFFPVALCMCGKPGKVVLQPNIRFVHPAIPDGEINFYEVLSAPDHPNPVAIRKMITTRTQLAEIPVFQITTVEQRSKNSPPIESIVVCVSRENMLPANSFHFSRPPKEHLSVAAIYHEQFVEIVSVTPVGESRRTIPIGLNTFDINELPMLGRALRFGHKRPYTILVVYPATSPPGGMSLTAEITHEGFDTITTPAGQFECNKIGFKTEATTQVFWFEKVGAHRMVQSQNITTGEIVRLIKTERPVQ